MAELARAEGGEALARRLAAVDPEAAARIHHNDARRIIRALEVHRLTGRTITALAEEQRSRPGPYAFDVVALAMDRERLYRRIGDRVDAMLRAGLAEEAGALFRRYGRGVAALQAIGYKEMAGYLDGRATLAEAAEEIKRNTRRYAKRQLTWFRHMPGVRWVDAETLAPRAAP